MGSATFLDAFDALSLAFVLPVLIKLWALTPAEIGWMIAASYIGQFARRAALQPSRRNVSAASPWRQRPTRSCRSWSLACVVQPAIFRCCSFAG